MTEDSVKQALRGGKDVEVYGDKVEACKNSPTGLKVCLSSGASYYANTTDIKRMKVVSS